jgi:hypothetical protein
LARSTSELRSSGDEQLRDDQDRVRTQGWCNDERDLCEGSLVRRHRNNIQTELFDLQEGLGEELGVEGAERAVNVSEHIGSDGSWVEGVGGEPSEASASGELQGKEDVGEFALTIGKAETGRGDEG